MSELVRLTATALAAGIRSGEFSAVEVAAAHINRIEQVNPRLNALIATRFPEARAEAEATDAARRRGEPLGPLAGVPVTMKDCFDVAGLPTTIGLKRLAGKLADKDSPLVERLRKAGAIVLGKTNVPQLMLLHECSNPAFGRTLNPWNSDRTAGGSSGGEAAIIAAGGSPLGLANDLGGSIRLPAHFCGIQGFKPTNRRLTRLGTIGCFTGMEAIESQPGPMARSVDDLTLAMNVLAAPGLERIDPNVPPVPWRDPSAVQLAGLRVAMWTFDGYFTLAPALRRAVDEAAAALRSFGVEVEPFEPPGIQEAMRLYFGILSADGAREAQNWLAGEAADPQVARLIQLGRIPRAIRPPVAAILRIFGQRGLARTLTKTGPISAADYWRLTDERAKYTRRFLTALDAGRFDAMLCPAHALPALTHGSFRYLLSAASYSVLFNLLGLPVGVVAATTVRPGEESERRASHDRVERAALAVEAASAGLPVGVQVAARHWREDIVLALMSALEAHFRRQNGYPETPTA
jgi:fatty acid amide hydrolase